MGTLHAIVGDVHGCYDALRHLEDRVAREADRRGLEPLIVSVGDLVDRGPDSAAVVRHVREGVAAGTHACVLGNHEQMMLATIAHYAPHLLQEAGCALHPAIDTIDDDFDRKVSPSTKWLPREHYQWFRALMWLAQGGVPTLASYGSTEPTDPATWQVDPADLAFLCGLPLVWRTEHVVVTHGLTDADGLAALDDEDDEKRRNATYAVLWGRSPPPTAPDPTRTHVSGHTPLPRVKRTRRLGLVQIDTGAFLGRRLSAWCAETDRVISVAAAPSPDFPPS